jgi:hypothetical protein
MNALVMKLWSDDAGYILSAESVFLFTITVLGITIGMAAVRNAVVSELVEVANAIAALDQGYSFNGLTTCAGFVNGTAVTDSLGGFTLSQTTPATTTTIDSGLACQ